MQLPTILASIAPVASTAKACLLVDFYYERDNNQRLYGKMKDKAKNSAASPSKAPCAHIPPKTADLVSTSSINARNSSVKTRTTKGRFAGSGGDKWHVTLENKIGENNWEPRAFGLIFQDMGNDERRLTEAVWGCTWEQIDSHKRKGSPNAEVHA